MKRRATTYRSITKRVRAAKRRGRYARPRRGYTRTAGYYGRFQPSGSEKKFFDTTDTVTVSTSSEIVPSLNLVPQDDTESGRIGRKITIKNIHLNGIFEHKATTDAGTATQGRIILYQDKQCNGTAAASTDILQSATPLSYRNLSESSRFNILWDKKFTLNTLVHDGSAFGSVIRQFKKSIKCNIPIEFDASATTGAITTIRSNNIGILFVDTHTTGGAASDSYLFQARIRYTDN